MIAADAAIPIPGRRYARVELWYVRGIDGYLYPTKIVAEAAARTRFPHEDEDVRYTRIGYVEYVRE